MYQVFTVDETGRLKFVEEFSLEKAYKKFVKSMNKYRVYCNNKIIAENI